MFKFSSHLDDRFYHLEKKMATHSNTLAWKIPWTEEPGRLQSMGLQRVGHDWVTSLSLSLSHDSLSKSKGRPVLSDSLWPHGLYGPWKSPGQEYWSGYPFPSPGIFPTRRSNPGLLHCWRILYQLSHKGSPRILEWVAYPFSSGSSLARNQTRVSCFAGGLFTNWAVREALINDSLYRYTIKGKKLWTYNPMKLFLRFPLVPLLHWGTAKPIRFVFTRGICL